jgi:hypothetical protein
MPRLGHTQGSLKLTNFVEKYMKVGEWHGYTLDKKTIQAVDRAELLGVILVNRETKQFCKL